MKNRFWAALTAAAGLAMVAAPAFSQDQGQGQAIVTVMPKHKGEMPPIVTQQDVTELKVNGKSARITSFQQLSGQQSPVELVILIDSAARTSIGRQLQDIETFVRSLPPNVMVGIAYMENGRAAFSSPLSANHDEVLRGLHLPAGVPGVSASPYFCLSALAKEWPSQNRGARREVVMITDGVDTYQPRFDPDDPYVQAAMTDAVRAGLVVYSIYWKNQGRLDNSGWENNAGQSLLTEVDQATGGKNFWDGFGEPVTFQPYFEELTQRLRNQYEIGFSSPLGGKAEVESFKLKLTAPGAEVDAPQQVLVAPGATAER